MVKVSDLEMRVLIAVHGTRGDIEPCAAVGRELLAHAAIYERAHGAPEC